MTTNSRKFDAHSRPKRGLKKGHVQSWQGRSFKVKDRLTRVGLGNWVSSMSPHHLGCPAAGVSCEAHEFPCCVTGFTASPQKKRNYQYSESNTLKVADGG